MRVSEHSTPRLQHLLTVVERDPHVRSLLAAFLEPLGCEVVFADDGMAALEMIRGRRPAVVITEMMLPRLDGLSLCRAIKLAPATSDIPVVVFSVIDVRQRAALAGADGFMLKPLAADALLAAIRPFLEIVPRTPGVLT
jgi:CheY-like chemotaxis protein